ncbi:DNA translocase FtsK, partial [bacterium]|nr:DNA translocase FtsK [bacterium]
GDVLSSARAHDAGPLFLGIGKDVSGESVIADLATMPHLLIAGSTGTGKSVCINALLTSILMRATPAEVRLILIDPKRIELSLYNGLPHLYVPVVTESKEAASALAWAVSEMERRLKQLQKAGARNIGMYNALVHQGKAPEGAQEMPYLVIVIDELADLMMVAAKEVEDSICRIAQLARAAGIHLIVATQRPSTDIITGLIKTNITNRIAFAVGSSIDSRVILDQPGAERLVGLGDMLFSTPAWAKPKRIQGAFVSEEEIARIVAHLKEQAEPEYHEEILHMKVAAVGGGVDSGDEDDPLIWEAADMVVVSGIGSTSLLQRRLKVGYARAGRIMDMLESKGVVGPPDGSKPREVLVDVEDLEALRAFERHDLEGEAD